MDDIILSILLTLLFISNTTVYYRLGKIEQKLKILEKMLNNNGGG